MHYMKLWDDISRNVLLLNIAIIELASDRLYYQED